MVEIVLKCFFYLLIMVMLGCVNKKTEKYIDGSNYVEKENMVKYCDIESFDLNFLILNGEKYIIDDKEYYEFKGVFKSNNVIMKSYSNGYLLSVFTDSTIAFNKYDLEKKVIYHKIESILGYNILEYNVDSNNIIFNLINYDDLFDFSKNDVVHFMDQEKINSDLNNYKSLKNFEMPVPHLYRGKISDYGYEFKSKKESLVWVLSDVQSQDKLEIFEIILDGQSGEELLRKRYIGKGPDKNNGTVSEYKILKMNSKIKLKKE